MNNFYNYHKFMHSVFCLSNYFVLFKQMILIR